ELVPGIMTRLKVLDASGAPSKRVEITAWPLSGASVSCFTLKGDGSFGPLPPGGVKILIASPFHKTAVLDLDLQAARKARRNEDLGEVRLQRGGSSLRGKVIARTERFPREALLRFDGVGQLTEVKSGGDFEFSGLSAPEPGKRRGKAMLILRRGQK